MLSQTMARSVGLLCLGAALNVACDNGKKKTSQDDRNEIAIAGGTADAASGIPKSFLTASDTAKPSNVMKIGKIRLADLLSKDADLFPPQSTPKPIEDLCTRRALGTIQGKTIGGRWLAKASTVKMTRCYEQSVSNVVVQVVELTPDDKQEGASDSLQKSLSEIRYYAEQMDNGKGYPISVITTKNNGIPGSMCEELGGVPVNEVKEFTSWST